MSRNLLKRLIRSTGTPASTTSDQKFAEFNVNNFTNEILAAVPGKKLRVLSMVISVNSTTNSVRLDSDITTIAGAMNIDANRQVVLGMNGFGWFETRVGEALNMNLGVETTVAGSLTYKEV